MNRLLLAAMLQFGCDSRCFFVDQTEGGIALVRYDDGRQGVTVTAAPEGSRVCDGRIERAKAGRQRRTEVSP